MRQSISALPELCTAQDQIQFRALLHFANAQLREFVYFGFKRSQANALLVDYDWRVHCNQM